MNPVEISRRFRALTCKEGGLITANPFQEFEWRGFEVTSEKQATEILHELALLFHDVVFPSQEDWCNGVVSNPRKRYDVVSVLSAMSFATHMLRVKDKWDQTERMRREREAAETVS
jgi:hypothetical protein